MSSGQASIRYAYHGTQVQIQRYGINKQVNASVEERDARKAKRGKHNWTMTVQSCRLVFDKVTQQQKKKIKIKKKKGLEPISGKELQDNCCRLFVFLDQNVEQYRCRTNYLTACKVILIFLSYFSNDANLFCWSPMFKLRLVRSV